MCKWMASFNAWLVTQTYYKLPDVVGNDGYLSLHFPVAPRSCICMLYSLNTWSEEEIEHTAQQRSNPSFSRDPNDSKFHGDCFSNTPFSTRFWSRTSAQNAPWWMPWLLAGQRFCFFFSTGLSCSKGLRPHDMSILRCSARYTFYYCFLYITLLYCKCIYLL